MAMDEDELVEKAVAALEGVDETYRGYFIKLQLQPTVVVWIRKVESETWTELSRFGYVYNRDDLKDQCLIHARCHINSFLQSKTDDAIRRMRRTARKRQ